MSHYEHWNAFEGNQKELSHVPGGDGTHWMCYILVVNASLLARL